MRLSRTLEILGGEDYRAEVVVLDEAPDLRRDLGPVPAHNKHLPYDPT